MLHFDARWHTVLTSHMTAAVSRHGTNQTESSKPKIEGLHQYGAPVRQKVGVGPPTPPGSDANWLNSTAQTNECRWLAG